MPYTFGEGGAVLLHGRIYDLDKVIAASERVADILTFRLGGGKAVLTTNRPEYDRRYPWSEETKKIARTFWLNAAEIYEAVDEPLVILTGPLRLRWYALGRTSVRYDGKRDLVIGHDGKEIVSVDPRPAIVIYGEPNRNLISAVGGAIRDLCEECGLQVWLAGAGPMVSEISIEGHVAALHFPHEYFGGGDGTIRVRCAPTEEES